jgi:hypothetical protein
MPVPSHPGPVRRIAPALRQNCIRSWPNHQLGTEAKAKNLSLERTRVTPSPPLPQVSRATPVASASAGVAELVSPAANTASSSATAPFRRAVAALGVTGPQGRCSPGATGRSRRAGGPPGQLRDGEPAAGARSGRARRSRESPRGQDGYRAGGSDFVAGDEGFSVGAVGGGPKRGRGGGPGAGAVGGGPCGKRPGGVAGGRSGPRLGEERAWGVEGWGSPPPAGRESFPRPVTGGRAGKLVLPRPA